MKEFLEFIFSSGWVFLGLLILIYAVSDGIAQIVRAWRGRP